MCHRRWISTVTDGWIRPLFDDGAPVPTASGRVRQPRSVGSRRRAASALCSTFRRGVFRAGTQSCQRNATRPAASRSLARRAIDGGKGHRRRLRVLLKGREARVGENWRGGNIKHPPVAGSDAGDRRDRDADGTRWILRTLRARARTRAGGYAGDLVQPRATGVHRSRLCAGMRDCLSADQNIIAAARSRPGRHQHPLRQSDQNRRQ
jgi:hypothetical protein